jgi:hypothetical protein
LTGGPAAATLGADSVPTVAVIPRGRRIRWDAATAVLVCLGLLASVPTAARQLGVRGIAGPADVREVLRTGDLVLSVVQVLPADGLEGASLRLFEGGRTREVALDGTLTGRLARGVSRVWWLPEVRRAVLHLDADHDGAGLLVVDAAADAVVDAVIGRDLTPSPSGRYWAMEEHAVRRTAVWPHNETVYAVYDAAEATAPLARACPSADDRCRGEVLFLPDRLARCRAIARDRGGSCLTPGREPGHTRRSPFAWLSQNEVAWVDVDRARQDATLVLATLRPDAPTSVLAVPLARDRVIEDVPFPPVREDWRIDRITRDGDPSRLWLHFRTHLPQAPLQRLGIRLN